MKRFIVVALISLISLTACDTPGGRVGGDKPTYNERLKSLSNIYHCHGLAQKGDKGSLQHPIGKMTADDLDYYGLETEPGYVRVAFCKD